MCLYTLGKLPWVKADAIAFGLGGGGCFPARSATHGTGQELTFTSGSFRCLEHADDMPGTGKRAADRGHRLDAITLHM